MRRALVPMFGLLLTAPLVAAPETPRHASFIAGTVTRSADGSSVEGAEVRAFTPPPSIVPVGMGLTGPDGMYSIDSGPGTFLVSVAEPTLISELIEGGSINGEVSSDLGGFVAGAVVAAFTATGAAAGSTTTATNGAYMTAALAPGTYFVRVSAPGYVGQLYNAIACPGGTCDPTTGTPIVVAAGPTTSGIDVILPSTGAPAPRQIVYLNRCSGGCTVQSGFESSINNTSSIIGVSTGNLPPYPYGDASFDALAACVRNVFQPYQIDVVTSDPAPVPHREHMVAGTPDLLGFGSGTGGVSPYACGNGVVNSISVTFAQVYGDDLIDLCWTATQEIGHQFALDHDRHAPDSMSYLVTGDFKSMTNVTAACGEYFDRACACGGPTQNSHVQLGGVVGLNPLILRDGFEDVAPDAAAALAKAPPAYRARGKRSPAPVCGTEPVRAIAQQRAAGVPMPQR